MDDLTQPPLIIHDKSGKEYRFKVYPINNQLKAISGIYILTHRYFDTTKIEYRHKIIYCNKAENSSIIFNNFRKINCNKDYLPNCLCIMKIDSEQDRDSIYKDILLGEDFLE